MTPEEQARERRLIVAAIEFVRRQDGTGKSFLHIINENTGLLEETHQTLQLAIDDLKKSFEKAAPAISPEYLTFDPEEVLRNSPRIKVKLKK